MKTMSHLIQIHSTDLSSLIYVIQIFRVGGWKLKKCTWLESATAIRLVFSWNRFFAEIKESNVSSHPDSLTQFVSLNM